VLAFDFGLNGLVPDVLNPGAQFVLWLIILDDNIRARRFVCGRKLAQQTALNFGG
jgi:hypothetical protein